MDNKVFEFPEDLRFQERWLGLGTPDLAGASKFVTDKHYRRPIVRGAIWRRTAALSLPRICGCCRSGCCVTPADESRASTNHVISLEGSTSVRDSNPITGPLSLPKATTGKVRTWSSPARPKSVRSKSLIFGMDYRRSGQAFSAGIVRRVSRGPVSHPVRHPGNYFVSCSWIWIRWPSGRRQMQRTSRRQMA